MEVTTPKKKGFVSSENEKSPDNSKSIPSLALDNSESTKGVQSTKSILWHICKSLDYFKIEVTLFLFVFSISFSAVTLTQLIITKECLMSFMKPMNVCTSLKNYKDLKTAVERGAAEYQLYYGIVRVLPSAPLAFFIGPWGSRYGRLPPEGAAVAGMLVEATGLLLCAIYLRSSSAYLLVPTFFTGISGGLVTNNAFFFSYASDMAPAHYKTTMFELMGVVSGIGIPLGILLGGWTYHSFGFITVFAVPVIGLFIQLIIVLFVLRETRGLDNEDPLCVRFKTFFTLESVRESLKAITKKRLNQGRKQVVLLITSICLLSIALKCVVPISYLFAHYQFNWGNSFYSTVKSVFGLISPVVILCCVPVQLHFDISDAMLGIIGTVSFLMMYLMFSLSFTAELYYVGSAVGVFMILAFIGVRSRLSKLLSPDDTGKIFLFVALLDNLLPVLVSIVITQIFTASLSFFPGLCYVFTLLLLLPPLCVFIWITFLPQIHDTPDELESDNYPEESINGAYTKSSPQKIL